MAEPKGILEMVGLEGGADEDEGSADGSPEARAVAEMFEAHEKGDEEAMGRAFKKAYRICAASKGKPTEGAKPDADEDSEEIEY